MVKRYYSWLSWMTIALLVAALLFVSGVSSEVYGASISQEEMDNAAEISLGTPIGVNGQDMFFHYKAEDTGVYELVIKGDDDPGIVTMYDVNNWPLTWVNESTDCDVTNQSSSFSAFMIKGFDYYFSAGYGEGEPYSITLSQLHDFNWFISNCTSDPWNISTDSEKIINNPASEGLIHDSRAVKITVNETNYYRISSEVTSAGRGIKSVLLDADGGVFTKGLQDNISAVGGELSAGETYYLIPCILSSYEETVKLNAQVNDLTDYCIDGNYHDYTRSLTRASFDSPGHVTDTCSICNHTDIDEEIPQVTASLTEDSYDYTGEPIEPKVNMPGTLSPSDYSIRYEDNVEVGTGKVIITLGGDYEDSWYTGSKTLEFEIREASEKEIVDNIEITAENPVYGTVVSTPEGGDYGWEWDQQTNKPVVTAADSEAWLNADEFKAYWCEDTDGTVAYNGDFTDIEEANVRVCIMLNEGYKLADPGDLKMTVNGQDAVILLQDEDILFAMAKLPVQQSEPEKEVVNNIKISAENPVCGTEVSTLKGGEYGWEWDQQSNKPVVTAADSEAWLNADEFKAYWCEGESGQVGYNGNFTDIEEANVRVCIMLNEGYKLADPGDLKMTVNGQDAVILLQDEDILFAMAKLPVQHNWSSNTVSRKATPTAAGSYSHSCAGCGRSEVTGTIAKASGFKLSATAYTYNGKARKPAVTVTDSAGKKIDAANYTVTYSNNIKAGTNTAAVKVTFKGSKYSGSKVIKFTINKAANTLNVKARTATVKFKAVKKKTQTLAVSKVMSFTNAGQGSKTYVKASGNKKITINKTTGKVTVNKGLKKGTYKVKVKVQAAGNANYKKSAVKIVTFIVIVK